MTSLRDVKDHKDLVNVSNLNEQVIEDFRASEGRVGGPFEGAPIILVHHVGVKTGTKRVSPLRYFPQDDGSMIIVASNHGAPENPAWYRNLKANPRTDVEVGTETFPVAVREITGKERGAVWAGMLAVAPFLDELQERAGRAVPLLRLTRVS